MFSGISNRVSRIFGSTQAVPGSSNGGDSFHRVPDRNVSSFPDVNDRDGMFLPMDTNSGFASGASHESSTTREQQIPAFPRGEIPEGTIQLIGIGSQGRCEKVFVPRLGICVLKTPNGTVDERTEQLRRREMVFTAMLNHHPNIIGFYGIVYYQNPMEPVGFLTEYMSGGSLRKYLHTDANKPIDISIKVAWAKQLTLAMSYMHSRGILHRDLNPNNILIDDLIFPAKIKICDFGLARVIDGNSLTLCTGTSCYMAPEVLVSRYYDHYVDVFSLAMTLYHIFMEKAPFADDDLITWNRFNYHNRLAGLLPDYPARPQLPDDLGDIATLITRCWSFAPSDRGTMDMAHAFLIEKYPPLWGF